MIKLMTFFMLLGYARGGYASSIAGKTTFETRSALWVSFQATDRPSTAMTAKKLTAEGLQSCKNWRLLAQKKFSTQLARLSECEASSGLCTSKGVCVTYWAVEMSFKSPLTLMTQTYAFPGPKSKPGMDACLKWTRDRARQEGVRFFWSSCNYEEPFEDEKLITGTVTSLMDLVLEPKSKLLRHHYIQVRKQNLTLQQYVTSSTDVRFPFKLQKSKPEPTDPEFKSSRADCDSWRTRTLSKYTKDSTGIEPCKLSGSSCQYSNPPTCFFSHVSRISWKTPRTAYTIERTFPSPETATQGFDACRLWLKEEQDFAPAATIDSNCSMRGFESSGGKTTYFISGVINQIER